ncbi:Putative transcriptional regulator [Acinetobacter baumannii]|nr:Putative transcriptional regulator [Acinetobacter baumannii]
MGMKFIYATKPNKDPTPLTHIIISIIDGIIIDGTIDKDLIDPSKKWQYIEYLIKTENP